MVFSSSYFLAYFLPVFLLIYFVVGKKLKNPTLLLFSLLFYSWGAPVFVFILLATTVLDFHLVQWMHNQRDLKKKKLLFLSSLSINILLLITFKYANFFVENVNEVLNGMGFESVGWTKIALPIGISFFVFESITYTVDVYRNIQQPLEKFSNYLLYILLFPKLIVGPIIPYRVIAGQITDRTETIDNRLNGFYRFCIGLAKKVLIANQIGVYTTVVFAADYSQLDAYTAWFGIGAFAFQIYFDFSGYSDMAIGLCQMLGFKIPENFDNPYISSSITEFWTRWHISLGKWMKEYIYIPLGGNRVASNRRLYMNLGLVFLISGLWHGASWNFVIWGVYHGLFLILERLFLLKWYTFIGRIPSMLFTFLIVVIGCVFFRIEQVGPAFTYLKRLFIFDGIDINTFDFKFYFFLIVAAILSFSTVLKIGRRAQTALYAEKQTDFGHLSFTLISLIVLIVSAGFILVNGFNPFIYFQF